MTKSAALALATLLVLGPALAHKGDGRFTDKAVAGAHARYELDLGPVDLAATGQREFRFTDLPGIEFVFGLRLRSSGGAQTSRIPRATVRMALMNEKSEVVFDVSDDLSKWVQSESQGEWFLYQRGTHRYVPIGPRATKAERVSPGPDGGWGTYFTARTPGSYRLTFETVAGDAGASKSGFRLVAVAGR